MWPSWKHQQGPRDRLSVTNSAGVLGATWQAQTLLKRHIASHQAYNHRQPLSFLISHLTRCYCSLCLAWEGAVRLCLDITVPRCHCSGAAVRLHYCTQQASCPRRLTVCHMWPQQMNGKCLSVLMSSSNLMEDLQTQTAAISSHL